MYGYLCACGMNLSSAVVWISEPFQRLYNARGEAERIIQPLESFKNPHPCPMTRRADSKVFSAFVKVRNFGLSRHADQGDEMYRYSAGT